MNASFSSSSVCAVSNFFARINAVTVRSISIIGRDTVKVVSESDGSIRSCRMFRTTSSTAVMQRTLIHRWESAPASWIVWSVKWLSFRERHSRKDAINTQMNNRDGTRSQRSNGMRSGWNDLMLPLSSITAPSSDDMIREYRSGPVWFAETHSFGSFMKQILMIDMIITRMMKTCAIFARLISFAYRIMARTRRMM